MVTWLHGLPSVAICMHELHLVAAADHALLCLNHCMAQGVAVVMLVWVENGRAPLRLNHCMVHGMAVVVVVVVAHGCAPLRPKHWQSGRGGVGGWSCAAPHVCVSAHRREGPCVARCSVLDNRHSGRDNRHTVCDKSHSAQCRTPVLVDGFPRYQRQRLVGLLQLVGKAVQPVLVELAGDRSSHLQTPS